MSKTQKTNKTKEKTSQKASPTPKVEAAEPMTFHDNVKKNIAWYGAAGALVSVVVLANILPNTSLDMPKHVVQNSFETFEAPNLDTELSVHVDKMQTEVENLDELEGLLKKNVSAVEGALEVVYSREKHTMEQLDGIAKIAHGLDARLQQLQDDLEKVQSEKALEEKVQNPNYNVLSQKIIFLTDAYHRGQVTQAQLLDLKIFAETALEDVDMVQKLSALADITPVDGPVTLSELSIHALELMHKGMPAVADLMQTGDADNGYMAQAKRYLSDWVQIQKLDTQIKGASWVEKMLEVQKLLAKSQVEKALKLLNESAVLQRDVRTNALKTKINLYQQQQNALSAVLQSYSQIYAVTNL